jgi:hypothetical protein
MESMKLYLKRNRFYVEITGILAAVTALFLPLSSEIASATKFLITLKFTLLTGLSFLILIGLGFLFMEISFIHGQTMSNNDVGQVQKIGSYTIFCLISLFCFSLIYGLWGYLYHTYNTELISLLEQLASLLGSIVGLVWFYLVEKILRKFFSEKDPFGEPWGSLGYIILSMLFFVGIIDYVFYGAELSKLSVWLFIGTTAFIFSMSTIIYVIRKRKR